MVELYSTLLYIFVFAFGAIIGSFLNVLILRIHKDESWWSGRSYCPNCHKELRWEELIPILSFVFLRGKCSNCSKKISWQYPLVELISALLPVFCLWKFGLSLSGILIYIVSWLLLGSFVSDLKFMELPEILYMSLESPVFFIKNRDWVQQRKAWKKTPNDNTFILHFKSVELDDVPETDKCVRAHTYISGYFVTKISENKSLLIIIAMNDIKGSIPKWLVNRESAKAPKKWVENLKKGMEIIRSNNKKKK